MPTPRKRITAPHPKENEPDFTKTEFEEEFPEEEEFEESDEEELEDDEIRVTYKEMLITRKFAVNQITKSGGILTRSFAPELHGKKYRALACQFIETMMLSDENTHARPRLIKAEGLTEDEISALGLHQDGTPKAQPNGVVPVQPIAPPVHRSQFEDED